MATVVTIITDFPEVGARLEAAAAATPGLVHASVAEIAHAARELGIVAIRDATPRRSGKLAESTTGEVHEQGDGAEIDFRQPATNEDGVEYVRWVIEGRGDVYPVNKKALAGPGFGPVRHAGPAAANDYVTPAMETLLGPLDAMLAERGGRIASEIVRIMQ